MARLSVQGYSNLVKDPTSGGIVNNDPKAFAEYKKKRELALQKVNDKKALENRVTGIEKDINNLKSDVNQIKNMLTSIIDKLT
jgi:hypothetical protein